MRTNTQEITTQHAAHICYLASRANCTTHLKDITQSASSETDAADAQVELNHPRPDHA